MPVFIQKLVLFFFLCPIFLQAQNSAGWAFGLVRDALTGDYIQGFQLTVPDAASELDTQPTDSLFLSQYGQAWIGKFQIRVQEGVAVRVSHPAYETAEIYLNESRVYTIYLRPKAYALEEVNIAAYHQGNVLKDHIGSLGLIDRQGLNREDQMLIAPALNRIPGVLMQSGALNTNRITIRGIGARSLFSTTKIRAYLDEIPLTTGEGETTLEDLDMGLLERVEVIKGPSSSVYGAGLGGTILMQSKKSSPGTSGLGLTQQLGAFGTRRTQLNLQQGGESGQFQLQYNLTHSDGFRENSTYDRQNLTALGTIYGGEKSRLTYFASWIQLKAFIPSSLDSATFADEPTAAAFTWNKTQGFEDYDKWLTGLSWSYQMHPSLSQHISVFSSGRSAYEVRPFNILRETTTNLGTRMRLQYRDNWGNTPTLLSLGAELFREDYSWATYQNINGEGNRGGQLSDNGELRTYYNVFLQGKWELPADLNLEAGLNLNDTRYTYDDFFLGDSVDLSGAYRFEPSLSPRIGLLKKIGSHRLHMSAAHGFSPPSLSETLTPDGGINPEIQPEKGWNVELGYRANFLEDRLFLDVGVYRMLIRDLLVAQRTGNDVFIGVNAGKTRHDGLEAYGSYQLTRAETSGTQLSLWGSYHGTRYRFVEFLDGEEDRSGNQLTGVPPHQLNLGLDAAGQKGWYANFNFLYVGAMPMRDDNSILSDPYGVLNAKAGYRTRPFKQGEIEVYIGVNNLLNETYASMVLINAGSFGGRAPRYYYPGQPRHIYGGLKIYFGTK